MNFSRPTVPLLLFVLLVVVTSAKTQSIFSATGYNRIGSEFWASGGAGIAEQGVNATAFANPALIAFMSPTVTLESGWRPETFMSGDSYDKTILVPSYSSIGFPIGSGAMEIGYLMPYRDRFSDGVGTFTRVVGQDTVEKNFEWNGSTIIYTVFAAVSYHLAGNTSVGVAAGLDFIRYNRNFVDQQEAKGTTITFVFGGITRLFETVDIGLSVHASTYRYLNYTIRSGFTGQVYDAATLAASGPLPSYPAKSPPGGEFGTSVQIAPWLTVLSSVEFQNWHSAGYYISDRWQYHAGAIASLTPEITLRAGYFTQWSPYSISPDYYDQYFLTTGVSLRVFGTLSATVAYQTSAPFTRKLRNVDNTLFDSFQQQVLSGGVSYSF